MTAPVTKIETFHATAPPLAFRSPCCAVPFFFLVIGATPADPTMLVCAKCQAGGLPLADAAAGEADARKAFGVAP